MKTFLSLASILVLALAASAAHPQQDTASTNTKTDVAGRHNDVAARVNIGTAISLIVPVALGVALVAFLAPMFQGLFAAPIPFGPTLGYARKSKSLFSGITQENVMNVLETLTKALDAFTEETAKPKA